MVAKRKNGYPIKIERSYYCNLTRVVRSWQKIANQSLDQLKPYVTGGTKILQDADNSNYPNWIHYVQQVLDLFSVNVQTAQTDQQIQSIATRFVYAVNSFSTSKLNSRSGAIKIKAGAITLNPLENNSKLEEYTQGKIAENADLIKTMRSRYIDQLKGDVYRSINSGGGVSELAHAITDRTGMTLRHADLIATDQTGKILAQIDSYRNQANGSTRYIWRSMEDSRVRPKHRELDGKEVRYDDPNGGDGGLLPGEPIRCRCYADPIN